MVEDQRLARTVMSKIPDVKGCQMLTNTIGIPPRIFESQQAVSARQASEASDEAYFCWFTGTHRLGGVHGRCRAHKESLLSPVFP